MIKAEEKACNDCHKPFKCSHPAETLLKPHEENAYTFDHCAPPSSFTVKVLGAVRINVLPAFIRLIIKDTSESRESSAPYSRFAVSMISDTWRGRPACLSTLSTTLIIDARLSGFSLPSF